MFLIIAFFFKSTTVRLFDGLSLKKNSFLMFRQNHFITDLLELFI